MLWVEHHECRRNFQPVLHIGKKNGNFRVFKNCWPLPKKRDKEKRERGSKRTQHRESGQEKINVPLLTPSPTVSPFVPALSTPPLLCVRVASDLFFLFIGKKKRKAQFDRPLV